METFCVRRKQRKEGDHFIYSTSRFPWAGAAPGLHCNISVTLWVFGVRLSLCSGGRTIDLRGASRIGKTQSCPCLSLFTLRVLKLCAKKGGAETIISIFCYLSVSFLPPYLLLNGQSFFHLQDGKIFFFSHSLFSPLRPICLYSEHWPGLGGVWQVLGRRG